ncbi:MAG: hypothetical protein ACT4PL_03375, partial [Phycisphaerales bacterium]
MSDPDHDPLGSIPGFEPAPRRRSGAIVFTSIVYAIALAACIVLILAGNGSFGNTPRESFVTAGLTGLILVLTVAPAGLVVALWSSTAATVRLNSAIRELTDTVRILSEQAALSDDARRVLNRSAEREMLRRAIEQDIAHGDWEAALVLCRELAERFGYRADAEEFRARIDKARAKLMDSAAREGAGAVDGLILQRRFDEAAREATRLSRLYSDEPRIAALPTRVADAKLVYKADCQRRFLEAAQHDRPGEAMEIMKDLDPLLSESEAAALKDTARGVVNKHREGLATLFKIAIEDQAWPEAVAMGKRIMNEYP